MTNGSGNDDDCVATSRQSTRVKVVLLFPRLFALDQKWQIHMDNKHDDGQRTGHNQFGGPADPSFCIPRDTLVLAHVGCGHGADGEAVARQQHSTRITNHLSVLETKTNVL